jgi:ribosomal protein L40E
MKKTTATVALLFAILCIMVVGSAYAQTLVGVSSGNTFKYDLSFGWTSTNPDDVVPPTFVAHNQTDYFEITVTTVTGSTVEVNTTWSFLNGTIVPESQIAEVSTGATGSIYVYAANLAAGSRLFPSTDLDFMVNETIPRYYQGSDFRETNHISFTFTGREGEVYSAMSLYFDKATGIVVEYTLTDVYTATPSQTFIRHMVLKDTNVWTMGPSSSSPTPTPPSSTSSTSPTPEPNGTSQAEIDPLIIALAIVVVAVLIVGVLAVKQRKKNQRQPKTAQKPATPTATISAKTTLICSKCGQENPIGSEFCNKCGTKLQE